METLYVVLEVIYSGGEEWDKLMKTVFFEESHQLVEFLVEMKGL